MKANSEMNSEMFHHAAFSYCPKKYEVNDSDMIGGGDGGY